MKRICPDALHWQEVFERLSSHAKASFCNPPLPPEPLILSQWYYSNDVEKLKRWQETVDWAKKNGCFNIVSTITDQNYYYVEEPIAL